MLKVKGIIRLDDDLSRDIYEVGIEFDYGKLKLKRKECEFDIGL
jgi:hypothetical protein